MALTTLLQIVQRAADEMGVPRPSAVAGNTDLQAQQLYAFANAVGADLAECHPWTALQTNYTLTTVAGQSDYPLPADFAGFVADTMWDRSHHWRLLGPDTPQMDRALRDSGLTSPVYRRFRRFGSVIRINPTPTVNGETLGYEYVSNAWARSSGGAAQSEFAADTDTTIWPGRLLVDGLKVKYMAAKGMYADPLRDDFEARRDRLVAADLGNGTLDMGGGDDLVPISNPGIPDGNWNLT